MLAIQDVVDGDVRVEEVWGRNENVRVVSVPGRGVFLKRPHAGDEPASDALAVEAAVYARLHDVRRASPLRPYVARLLGHDASAHVLALELLDGTRSADELDEPEHPFGIPRIGDALAVALAACHATRASPSADFGDGDFLDSSPPFVIEFARPSPDRLQSLTQAQIELLKYVQSQPHMCRALDEMHRTWSGSCLIHGDIKWSNVLVRFSDASVPHAALWLVDWESASWGDAAWDVGSAFHGFLLDCVHFASDKDADTVAATFGSALPVAQHETRRLWDCYVREAGLDTADSRVFLERAVRCCAARLLQSAYEWSAYASRMPRAAVGALQLSVNMMQQPREASGSLLGIPARH